MTMKMTHKVSLTVIVIYVNNNTVIVPGNDGNNWVKIGYTQLTRKDKDGLLGGEWLNDFHIHAIQQLIQLDPDLQHIRGLMLFVTRWCRSFILGEITGLL